MSEHEVELTSECRMPIWPMFNAVIKAVESDWTGHLPDCGYTDEHHECGCAEFGGKVYAALKPFAARLADAEARAEAAEAKVARVEIAGQMKHITTEMIRGDQPLDEKEELIADLQRLTAGVNAGPGVVSVPPDGAADAPNKAKGALAQQPPAPAVTYRADRITEPVSHEAATSGEESEAGCRCDGAVYFTPEQNRTRRPFLVTRGCPIHGGEAGDE